MLGKESYKKQLKRLLRDGIEPNGVIIARQHPINDQGNPASSYPVQVRVRVDDGSTVDSRPPWAGISYVPGLYIEHDTEGQYEVGDIVPVRYDPADHSKIVVDHSALRAQHATAQRARDEADEAAKAAAIARGEAEVAGGEEARPTTSNQQTGANTGDSDPVDRIAKLADLRQRGALTEEEFAAEKAKILGES
ncbi:MAG: SHOCT domain-containing protein [Solirubrobacteraceae bacterium]